ncbi:hypothetical protein DACRYDRAFT_21999 [Dacryopinax primogenitus]|uniref:Uncharacterized protein n=1 Tax=Dacryopinax primogenitus (strain DJM 731) TaxID=1858805 RepID=M5G0N6_DACPD|nr:uncharacterized protein DACRYDRAFT_21999 [Dacryopinax primogenitus]EJU02309.1 hypothetical protein DACRYDRAFT_21999 [Dacryopinax primogenitus]
MVKQESLGGQAPDTPIARPVALPLQSKLDEAVILGCHRFSYSETQVDAHIDKMLALWTGDREPIGVDVEDVNRCWRCPYEEGCEWREMKAKEFTSKTGVHISG